MDISLLEKKILLNGENLVKILIMGQLVCLTGMHFKSYHQERTPVKMRTYLKHPLYTGECMHLVWFNKLPY